MDGTIKVIGIEGLEGKLTDKLAAGPARRLLNRAGISVRNDAVLETPVDTGRLRQNIAWEVDPAPMPRWVRVGTNVEYGPDVELGTPPHEVDPAVLEPWARRHDMNAYHVSQHIARFGTKAHPFLVPALASSTAAIEGHVAVCAQEIEALQG